MHDDAAGCMRDHLRRASCTAAAGRPRRMEALKGGFTPGAESAGVVRNGCGGQGAEAEEAAGGTAASGPPRLTPAGTGGDAAQGSGAEETALRRGPGCPDALCLRQAAGAGRGFCRALPASWPGRTCSAPDRLAGAGGPRTARGGGSGFRRPGASRDVPRPGCGGLSGQARHIYKIKPGRGGLSMIMLYIMQILDSMFLFLT